MKILKAGDTISGQEATAYITIDGNVEELFYARNLEATFEKNKEEVRTLGKRATQSKTTGWTGTGSMNVYYVATTFRKLALAYAKEGRDIYFKIVVTNEDKTSSIGRQTVALLGCNTDSVVLTKFDTESAVLDEDMDFTFDDFDIPEEFNEPAYGLGNS